MASVDRRELILARLLVISAGISGIRRATRNQEDASARLGPMIGQWDGDETSLSESRAASRGAAPRIMEMTPELRIFQDAPAETIGTTLNGFRVALLKAVLDDSALLAAVGPNGGIFYRGLSTETRNGERIEGGVSLTFAFQYPLIISEL